MEENYPVCMAGVPVGTARVVRRGLYYVFSCRCDLRRQALCELVLQAEKGETCLGILIPMDGRFGLETSRAVSSCNLGCHPSFLVRLREENLPGRFIPVEPDRPFAYFAQLADLRMAEHDGQLGVLLPPEKEV